MLVQRRDVEEFLLALAVVEIHHIVRVSNAAIRTRVIFRFSESCPELLLVA